jgi:hypothetical protein
VHSYINPYDSRGPLELPATYQYFWVNREGNILGTNDATVNPNTGTTSEWKQMPRHRP